MADARQGSAEDVQRVVASLDVGDQIEITYKTRSASGAVSVKKNRTEVLDKTHGQKGPGLLVKTRSKKVMRAWGGARVSIPLGGMGSVYYFNTGTKELPMVDIRVLSKARTATQATTLREATTRLIFDKPHLQDKVLPILAKMASLDDPAVLDDLVEQEAYSMGVDPRDAEATRDVKKSVDKFISALEKCLADYFKEHPLKGYLKNDSVDEQVEKFMGNEGDYLVFMTLRGEGRGMFDGDLNHLFSSLSDIRGLANYLSRKLSKFVNDTGTGDIASALQEAVYETTGQDGLSVSASISVSSQKEGLGKKAALSVSGVDTKAWATFITKRDASTFAKNIGWRANDVIQAENRFSRFWVVGQNTSPGVYRIAQKDGSVKEVHISDSSKLENERRRTVAVRRALEQGVSDRPHLKLVLTWIGKKYNLDIGVLYRSYLAHLRSGNSSAESIHGAVFEVSSGYVTGQSILRRL